MKRRHFWKTKMSSNFELIKKDGKARRGVYHTAHGDVQTPVFMNVGTQAAIKGALSAVDLKNIGCQVELSNTYHLHVRPDENVVRMLSENPELRFCPHGRPFIKKLPKRDIEKYFDR